jgi:hypothetical protein
MPHQEKEETRIQKPGTRIIARSEGAPDGRVGVWACGRVGVWACGRVGVWGVWGVWACGASGRVGVSACRRCQRCRRSQRRCWPWTRWARWRVSGSADRPEGPWEHSPGFSLGLHVCNALGLKDRRKRERQIGSGSRSNLRYAAIASFLAVFQTPCAKEQRPRLKPGLCFKGPSGPNTHTPKHPTRPSGTTDYF